MQLVINMPEMPPDSPVVHPDPAGNFLVGKALGQQLENLVLARRKFLHFRGRLQRPLE